MEGHSDPMSAGHSPTDYGDYLAAVAIEKARKLMDDKTNTVLVEVWAERQKQDLVWGGPTHDDTHTGQDWRGFIRHQLTEMVDSPDNHRDRFIKIAALAVAAVESMDRK